MSRTNIENVYPLSPMQEGMLFDTRYAPGSGVYFVQIAWTLRGGLDVPAFVRAFQTVVDRHATLRTGFAWERLERPMAVVRKRVTLPVHERDLRGVARDEQERELSRYAEEDRRRGFDVTRPPLMRLAIFRLDEDTYRSLWSRHHLLLDGWSTPLVVKELFTLYEAQAQGRDVRLSDPRPYAEYIAWIGAQDRARAATFWRRRLGGFSAPTPLGVDRAAVGEARHGAAKLALSEDLSGRLTAFARRHQLTPSTLVQGAWALLLARYGGERDVVFGATVSGRSAPLPDIDRMIGMFINTLPVRVDVDSEARALAWLSRLQQDQVELRDHEQSALVEIHGASDVPRGTPLFESVVVFENYPVEQALDPGGGRLAVADSRTVERSSVPLTLLATLRKTLTLQVSYDATRFDDGTIERMLGHVAALLEAMIASPEPRLGEMSALLPEERHRVVVAWNATAFAHPGDALLHERVTEQATRTPAAVAVSFGGAELRYSELDARANQLARLLRQHGVHPEALVGVCMDRSLDLVVALLAVLKAGGAYVPLDPEYPRDRLAFMIEDARPKVILTQGHLAAVLPPHAASVLRVDADWPSVAAMSADPLPREGLASESLAYVIYTSGSTGRPKGAMNAHRGVLNRLLWAQHAHALGAADRVLQKTPFSFDVSVWELFWPLLAGAELVMAQPGGHRDPRYLIDTIASRRLTLVHFVPSMLATFLDELSALGPEAARGCGSLRRVLCSGEALPPALAARFFAILPGVELHNLYGPTEAAIEVTAGAVSPEAAVTIGRPVHNTQVYVLDARREPVPVGVRGELYIGGAQVGRGYLNRPDLTAERFVCDPFSGVEGARLYRTGDVARWLPSGEIDYLGRVDFQVKLRGFRIELGEIEATLLTHPAIRETVVIAREVTPGTPRLLAYLVARADTPLPTTTALRAFLAERLPEHMIPAIFVPLSAVPLTASGKVNRPALPEPADAAALPAHDDAPPRGPVEEAIAEIYAEVLRIPRERVGAHHGFFELGGHSLLATQALTRVNGALGVALPLPALFEAPTPAELAARVMEGLGRHAAVPPILRVTREGSVPLSFGQERLWFLAQLDPGDTSYHIPIAVRMEGALDEDALRRAFDEIVRRHEVLRTTFANVDGQPRGVVHPSVTIPLAATDLTGVPPAARDAALREAVAAEARAPFDLARGPLLRARLVALGPEVHVLLLTLHHVVTDQWSRAVWNREISVLYEAFRHGAPSPLPELPIQYADYAAWQRAWLSGDTLETELAYWKQTLDGAPNAIDLPTDRPRPGVRSNGGARHPVALSTELTRGLRDLAHREGVTLYMLLLAALDVLLHRYTGQGDVVVGSPIAGRTRAETEGLIGFFLNTLVLRVRLDDEITFKTLLQRVKAASLGAFAHQDMPFERLVQEISPERDLGRAPLFQVVFNLQNAPREAMALPGVRMGGVPVEPATTKYDLTLILVDAPSRVTGSLSYSTDLFDAPTAARMVEHFEGLLRAAVARPGDRLRDLPMLPHAERQRLLVGWNDTRMEMPLEETLVDLFDAQADQTPGALALVAGGERLTFGELDARANRLAHHLKRLGAGPDVVVGICLPRSAELIVALLGILKSGAAYLPLDPTYPKARLAQMLAEARPPATPANCGARPPTIVVTLSALDGPAESESVRLVRLDADRDAILAEPDARPESEIAPHHLAYVLFTSGSTGQPRGVAVEHCQLVNYVRGVRARLDLPDTASYAHVSTFSADLGNTALFPPLCTGGTLHVVPEALTTDPDGLGAYFQREGIDCLKIVPSHLAALLSGAHPERVIPRRLLVLGGEASSFDLVSRVERLAPGCRIMNHYGPTETTVGALTFAVSPESRPETANVPLGRPLPNLRVYVLDASMAPTPTGVPGEVYIGGDGVTRGYLGQPELTAARFVPDPWGSVPGARLYRTGDRARYLPDGALLFLGRIDLQVKVRGYRVELGEIEAALVAGPAVAEAVVLAPEESPGVRRLVAYVVPKSRPAPDVADLGADLAERLPAYMVPSAFILLDALPLTANGKIDRRALAAVQPRANRADDDAPRSPVEEVLVSIWADVFGRERVGIHERFADLGGHSLLAIQIVARARDAFQTELPLRAIFEAPTIALLAAEVDRALGAAEGLSAPPLERAPRDRPLELSFAQERLWFLHQLDPESDVYNVPSAVRLGGSLDVAALERALAGVVRRHEVLRTTFASVDGKPVQIVHEDASVALPVVRWPTLGPAEREEEARREASAEAQRPFDLAHGPLFRARLLVLDEEDHVLLITLHHIVSDGWTRGILNRELAAFYRAALTGEAPKLPDLPIQYADYAHWQRRWLAGDVLDRQIAYWKRQLDGAPPVIALPLDKPRPPVQTFQGARRDKLLPVEVQRGLNELSRREGVTLYMTLLAALDVLLHRWTGQRDVVVGTSVSSRGRVETEGLIGFFINALVLRVDVPDEAPFTALLQRVREVCLGAYAHQDMPFERLVQEISPEPDPSRAPLFQVIFTMHNAPREAAALAGLALRGFGAVGESAKYDLTFFMSEARGGGIAVSIQYNRDLFEAATIERMMGHLASLLTGIARDAERRVCDLPMLGEDERRRVLVQWNDVAAPPAIDACVHELFERQARATPDAIAVTSGASRLTFRELDARANRLARRLQREGVGAESVVGLCLSRSASLVVGLLGVLKAGGAYLPLDPAYPPHRLAELITGAGARVVVTEDRFEPAVPADGASVIRLDGEARSIAAENDDPVPATAVPANLAYVLFTSGSTGKPKGVTVEHRNLVHYVRSVAARLDLPAEASYALVSTFSADLGNTVLFPPLCLGGTLHVVPEELATDAAGFGAHVREQGIDCLKIVPTHLSALLSGEHPEQVIPNKLLVLGGESSSWELVERLAKLAPGTRILNHYGPTETTVGVVTYSVERSGRVPNTAIVPLGRPLPGAQIYVLDAALEPTPVGVPGEVYVGGAGVTRGYQGDAGSTASRFIADPFGGHSGARLYRTGDRARWLADGTLVFLGRVDAQVKIRGHRVELGEIEATLATRAGVRNAVVLAAEDATTASKHLVAYVVPVTPGEVSVSELRGHLRERLPEHMVPSSIVLLAALPLTSNGKIDRRALSALGRDESEGAGHAAPSTPIEEVLAGIWDDVFGGRARIGVHDRFADLGGHSLLAIQIIARARAAFGVEVPLRAIFEAPTVAGLAERVEAAMRDDEGVVAPPLARAARSGALPLSFAQERLWFLDRLDPGGTAYHVPVRLRLAGELDVGALARALGEIVQRHEILRTTFASVDGEPTQVIHASVDLALAVEEVAGRDAVQEAAAAEMAKRFDLEVGPLVRVRLLRLSPEEHVLLMTLHHIISDAWTRRVLLRELGVLYEAFHAGRASPLGELPVQYADYAVWQRGWLRGDVLERQLEYWKEQLAGAPAALDLPTDRPRPPVFTGRGARRRFALSTEARSGLLDLSRREDATLFMTLLAAFDALLYRYTGEADLVVGTPVAGRTRAEVEPLIGFFVNTLAIRVRCQVEASFAELLGQVREQCLGAYAHQDIPFERLVRDLAPERDLSRTPLFQVSFTLQSTTGVGARLPGLSLSNVGGEATTAKFDLTLALTDGPDGLVGTLEYNTDLFDAATIARMVQHFTNLVTGVIADPQRAIFALPLLSDVEHMQALTEWNETAAPWPEEATVHALFEAQVDRNPHAVALVFQGREVGYGELDRRANQLAHRLAALGVGPESRVGIGVERSPEMIVAVLGTLKAGAAWVPLDPAYPRERLDFMIADAGIATQITRESVASATAEPETRPAVPTSPASAAYVIYTSGSTGRPKGVVVEHRGLTNLATAQVRAFGVGPGSRVLQFASLNFDASAWEILMALLSGATLVLASQEALMPGPDLLGTLEAHAVSVATLPPSALAVMPPAALPALATLVVAGEACSEELVSRWAPGRRFWNAYGPTETSVCASLSECFAGAGKPTIGRPLDNVQLYVLDAHGQPVPVGVPGELCVGGAGLARGYLGRADLTAERFVAHPFGVPGARIYRTGDRARHRADGEVELLGRVDHQVKLRGFRVELGEIEAVLGQHGAVAACAVIVREDSPGDRRLVAYVVRGRTEPPPADLRAFLAHRLPDYMMPAAFVTLPALPLTPNGKVDRRALPAPDPGARGERPHTPPRGPVEEALAGIFADLLGLPAAHVGAHDGFFELGGHSLLATQAVSRIRAALGVDVPLRALFEAPTVAGLARRVDAALRAGRDAEPPPLLPAPADAEPALSFAQERLWFIDQLEPGSAAYAMPVARSLRGVVDRGALERAFQALVARHAVLRTTFAAVDGRPVAVVHATLAVPLPVEVIADIRDARALAIAAEVRRPFDLATGPLLRLRLFQVAEDEHVLVVTMHHIVSDGWSLGVMWREVGALYRAFTTGDAPALPELPIQYADHARWQRAWLQGEALERQISYWKAELEGAPHTLDLPADRPHPTVSTHRGARCVRVLPSAALSAARELSRREGVTLFMTLVAALGALLHRVTGQEDILVGTPIAGRTHAETEALLGLFVNTLVLRVRLAGEPTFRELCARVRETCLGAYAHQDLPFERLVQEVAPERDLGRTLLFQVLFALQNAPGEPLSLPGIEVGQAGTDEGAAKVDLSLALAEGARGLSISAVYDADRFDEGTISRLLDAFVRLLVSGVRAPETPLWQLPLLGDEERSRVLVEWNATHVDYPRDATIHDLFAEQAAARPEATAVAFGSDRLTYRELDRRANQLAHHLRSYGVAGEAPVGLYARRSLEMVVATLAILKAGGAYLPLDPETPDARLAWMLDDARVAVVVAAGASAVGRTLGRAALVDLVADAARIAQAPEDRPAGTGSGESLAYVMYTSGSTGTPKGVCVPHRGVVRLVKGARYARFGSDEVFLQLAPIAFDAATFELWAPLLNGGQVVAFPDEPPTPALLGEVLRDRGVTTLWLTAGLFNAVIDESPEALAPLRQLLVGGEALSVPHVRRALAALPGLQIINGYGPTEGTTFTCCHPIASTDAATSIPLGRPIANTRVYVLDQRLQPVPVGVPGELYIGGDGLARGYLNRPDLTADRFGCDPFSAEPGARLYRTGDRVRWLADGTLAFLGRLDHQVKLRGFRIELGEIEAVLGAHPQVLGCAVLVREDAPGDRRLVAYVVVGDAGPDAGALRTWLRERLPEYMVPAVFVGLGALPLTPNGKVDRSALLPPEIGPAGEHAFTPPRGPVEEALVGIFADVLKLPAVGARDGFFALGGHSLLATQAISRIREALGVDLPLRALFEAPTAAELARCIEEALGGGAGDQVPPITALPRDAELRPSFAQERMWFLAQLDPDDPSYVVPMTLRFRGAFDRSALERALGALVARHEVLRTTYRQVDDHPTVSIQSSMEVPFVVTPVREADVAAAVAAEMARPFDLETGPLLRARVLELAAEDHLLVATMDHIVVDAWTVAILRNELTVAYAAFAAGRPHALPELPLQYADYAGWQRRWLSGEVFDRQLAYWKEQLAGAPTALDLPIDRARPSAASHRGARRTFALGPELSAALARLGRDAGTTRFMTLLAAFELLLYRYTGQDDVVVGTPIANRSRPETERMVGFFLNTLVIRVQLAPELTFRGLLGRVREACVGAYAHQEVPFERLVQEIDPERDTSRTPLFQVMFTFQTASPRTSALAGLEGSVSPVSLGNMESATAKFDLLLAMSESAAGITGALEYATDLFDASTIDRMVENLRTVLGAAAEAPETRLRDLPVMSASERSQVLEAWNATEGDYPRAVTIPDLFEAQAAATPDAVAVTFAGQALTYRALDARANQLAHALRQHGVGPDVPVGICARRSIELVLGILAIFKAGGAYASLDPEYPRERLAFMVRDAAPPVILADAGAEGALPEHGAAVLRLDDAAAFDVHRVTPPERGALRPDHLAYLIYTSGSTGHPKGVAMTQRPLVNLIAWQHAASSGALRALQFASPSFDVCFQEIFSTWLAGGTLVLVDEETRRDPRRLFDHVRGEQVERLFLPPVALYQLAEVERDGGAPAVREILAAGEALQVSPHVMALLAGLPGCVLRNQYGPSETHVVTEHVVSGAPALPPIGRPIRNVRTYLLDERLDPVPLGARGELHLGGVQLARGYLARPDLTAERFLPDPFAVEPGARMYRTGDVARFLADGTLELFGRTDTQVKIRGFRVELGEIEAVLGSHPHVGRSAVLVREDAPGDLRLVAYVVAAEAKPAEAALRAWLRERLPDYMVPVAFVDLDALPLTPSGKVDRRALPPPGSREPNGRGFTPGGPVEEILAGIWADVLRREQVGIHENFFELGGHSLLATRVMARIATSFSVEVPLQRLFAAPTVAELAAHVTAALADVRGAALPPLVRAARDGELLLSFGQERFWFLNQLDPEDAAYSMPLALRLAGPLDRGALARALAELGRRHEVLRTTFAPGPGHPVAVIHGDLRLDLPLTDLSSLPEAAREAALREGKATEVRRPFDLRAAPPIRARLFALGDEDHVLVVVMHHVVTDAWSLAVLNGELSSLYRAFSRGEPSPLPEPSLQYADYAQWQRRWFSGEAFEKQAAYWRQALAGAPAALDLPTDRPRPAVLSHRGGRRPVRLGPDLTAGLEALARREGATLFMTLLAVFDVLLHRWSGQDDVLVGAPIANRLQVETEGMLGFFVNVLVLRARPAGDMPFRELLHQVRDTCLGAYAHQDMPFERLVQQIAPARDLSRPPVFQVSFVLQNAPEEAIALPGLATRGAPLESTTTQIELSLSLTQRRGALTGVLEFATDLFDATTIDRMLGHLAALGAAAVENPTAALDDLPLLQPAERAELLSDLAGAVVDLPSDACAHELFAARASLAPEATALLFDAERLSYRELDERSNRLARYLRRFGVGAESLVGVAMHRSPLAVVALLGVLKAGGAYVPLDPTYPEERLQLMLSDSGVTVLLSEDRVLDDLPIGAVPAIAVDASWSTIAAESSAPPEPLAGPANAAYVIYTSGSTGRPKGVIVEHRGLGNLAAAQGRAFGVTPESRVLWFASLSFDASVSEMLMALLSGATLVVARQEALMPGPDLVRTLTEKAVSVVTLPPSALAVMPAVSLPALATLAVAGEACPAEIVDVWAPGRRFLDAYGPTEATVCATMGECVAGGGKPSIGRPMANVRVYVLDARLEPSPIGVPGEIHVGGVGVARGYLGHPELTAARFVPDPFGPGGRLYRTGDRARWLPDGRLDFLGRVDHQVKVRGYRIELGEIEAVLAQHPTVAAAVVLVREQRRGDPRLVAHVLSEEGLDVGALRAFLAEKLPEHMIPSVFVRAAALPLLPNGKIDRAALAAIDPGAAVEGAFAAPRTPTEQVIAAIWREVLDVPRVGVEDDFFELGGHSLLATQVMARIAEALRVELSLATLFEVKTVAGLAAVLDAVRDGRAAPPEDAEREEGDL